MVERVVKLVANLSLDEKARNREKFVALWKSQSGVVVKKQKIINSKKVKKIKKIRKVRSISFTVKQRNGKKKRVKFTARR